MRLLWFLLFLVILFTYVLGMVRYAYTYDNPKMMKDNNRIDHNIKNKIKLKNMIYILVISGLLAFIFSLIFHIK